VGVGLGWGVGLKGSVEAGGAVPTVGLCAPVSIVRVPPSMDTEHARTCTINKSRMATIRLFCIARFPVKLRRPNAGGAPEAVVYACPLGSKADTVLAQRPRRVDNGRQRFPAG
jgi:hypothetical protein